MPLKAIVIHGIVALVTILAISAAGVGIWRAVRLAFQEQRYLPSPTAQTAASAPGTSPTSALPSTTTATAITTPTSAIGSSDQPAGVLTWHDSTLRNDAVTVSVQGLPQIEVENVYAAWLANNDNSLALGTLRPADNGEMTLTYMSPTHENLLGIYDRVYITEVPAIAANTEVENVIMTGGLPRMALEHIRHLLFRFNSTPNQIGFALGVHQEIDELLRHVELVKSSFDQGSLERAKPHVEHMINIIEGAQGEHFGDLDGNGKIENPGDGFGLLDAGQHDGYIKLMIGHAAFAAEADDATSTIRREANNIKIVGGTMRARLNEIRDRALQVSQASSIADVEQDVLAIVTLSQQLVHGVDLNQDQRIDPVPGEGGLATAYQQAQAMATISIMPSTVADAPPPVPPAPVPAPPITIVVSDYTYLPSKLNIPVGATVVWQNDGGAHTVNAEDRSFNSGTISSQGTFSHTFTVADYFPYYCEFHGGPHGEGMSGTIVVSEPSPASEAQGTGQGSAP